MASDAASGSRVARAIDGAQYAVGLTLLFGGVVSVTSVLLGNGLNGIKVGLFALGVLTGSYATLLAWPHSPEDLTEESGDEETAVQAAIRRFPPASRYPVDPDDRYPHWVRLYLASLTTFATSYALEAVLQGPA
ncbi:MAG: hypothetical protein ABEJ84_07020 [Halodesulfurarchaeum sp.]